MTIFNDIEDLLFDGSKDDIAKLSHAKIPISYIYYPNSKSFYLAVENQRAKMHGLDKPPNCVAFFGLEHTF